jgi:hypothetical protein
VNFNPDDWIELYNPNSTAVDLSNWQIKDDDDTHIFTIPEGTQIGGEDFLVFVKDASDFINVFPNMSYLGELGFGFGGSDSVRLFNSTGTLQDEVVYQSDAPWPSCADETGYTLELIAPDLDNSLPENWDCININGSPNAINNSELSTENSTIDTIIVYPNPVKNFLYIGGHNDRFDVEVYSILGQKVMAIKATNQVNLSPFDHGMYLLKIKTKTATIIRKVLKY